MGRLPSRPYVGPTRRVPVEREIINVYDVFEYFLVGCRGAI